MTHGIIPEITVSFHGTESHHFTHEHGSDRGRADLPDEPLNLPSHNLSLDGNAVPTEQNETPLQSEPLSPITRDNTPKARFPKIPDQFESGSGESEKRAMSDTVPSTQSSKEDDTSQAPSGHSGWSEGTTVNIITVNMSPTLTVRSRSCETVYIQSSPKAQNMSSRHFPRANNQLHPTKEGKGRIPLTTSHSVPGNMVYQVRSSNKELEDASDMEDVETDSSGLMMKELSDDMNESSLQSLARVTREEQSQGKLIHIF